MCRGTWGRSTTGWGTLRKVGDGSGDPRGGLRRVKVPSGSSGTGWGGAGRVKGLSGRSKLVRGTLGEVRDGLGDP